MWFHCTSSCGLSVGIASISFNDCINAHDAVYVSHAPYHTVKHVHAQHSTAPCTAAGRGEIVEAAQVAEQSLDIARAVFKHDENQVMLRRHR